MTERSIVDAAARLRRYREPYLVATVVCVHGAACRGPGARMILTRYRWVAGSVSGGCLEGDLSHDGWWMTRGGSPALLAYDARVPLADHGPGADDDLRAAFGLGGDGVVEVLLERAGGAGRIDALEVAARCLRDRRRGAVATVFRGEGGGARPGARVALVDGGALEEEAEPLPAWLRDRIAGDLREVIASGAAVNRSYALPGGGTAEVLLEAIVPPPRLFLFGTGHDAVPVAQLARQLGWEVVICAGQPRHATRERFVLADEVIAVPCTDLAARVAEADRAVAVVMNHDLARDRDALAALLATPIGYVGVLGPRARARRLLRELGLDEEDPRVHAPVGLDLGGETPQEIALAIVAELLAVIATPAARLQSAALAPAPAPAARASGAGSAAALAAVPAR